MPTADRRVFVPRAIAYFLRQDYPDRELVIVDDGVTAIADLVPLDPRIRYVRLEERRSLGVKRNLACQEASGEIIVHWDDDDWMADRRITYQVTSLLQRQADICGLDRLIYYEPMSDRAWQYIYPGGSRPWVSGCTLCYTRSFWNQNQFLDVSVGEDNRFLWSRRRKVVIVLEDSTFYVAMIHPGNTSPKRLEHAVWHPYPAAVVRTLLGADWGVYVHR